MFRHCLLIEWSCSVPVTTVHNVYFIQRFLLASPSVFFLNSSTVISNLQTNPCHFRWKTMAAFCNLILARIRCPA